MTQTETMMPNLGPGRTDLILLQHRNDLKVVENWLLGLLHPQCAWHVWE